MSADVWMDAYREMELRVEQHDLFPALVREVAVDEAPLRWGARHVRNCPAYNWGVCLACRSAGGYYSSRRAFGPRGHLFAKRIAEDLNLLPMSPASEGYAVAYVTARRFVEQRKSGRR